MATQDPHKYSIKSMEFIPTETTTNQLHKRAGYKEENLLVNESDSSHADKQIEINSSVAQSDKGNLKKVVNQSRKKKSKLIADLQQRQRQFYATNQMSRFGKDPKSMRGGVPGSSLNSEGEDDEEHATARQIQFIDNYSEQS